jgi:hypothetical protein
VLRRRGSATGHAARMTSTPIRSGPSLRRPFLLGVAAGFLGTLPVVYLALLVPLAEVVVPLLLPGVRVLRAVLGRGPRDVAGLGQPPAGLHRQRARLGSRRGGPGRTGARRRR